MSHLTRDRISHPFPGTLVPTLVPPTPRRQMALADSTAPGGSDGQPPRRRAARRTPDSFDATASRYFEAVRRRHTLWQRYVLLRESVHSTRFNVDQAATQVEAALVVEMDLARTLVPMIQQATGTEPGIPCAVRVDSVLLVVHGAAGNSGADDVDHDEARYNGMMISVIRPDRFVER